MSYLPESDSNLPRKEKKQKKIYVNEDIRAEVRNNRVSFKNFIRHVEEEEIFNEGSAEEYAVLRGVQDYDDVLWHEIAVYPTEDEAEDEAEKCRQGESEFGVSYKVEQIT